MWNNCQFKDETYELKKKGCHSVQAGSSRSLKLHYITAVAHFRHIYVSEAYSDNQRERICIDTMCVVGAAVFALALRMVLKNDKIMQTMSSFFHTTFICQISS